MIVFLNKSGVLEQFPIFYASALYITLVIVVREFALTAAPPLRFIFGEFNDHRFLPVTPLRTCSAATGKNYVTDDPAS